MQGVLGQEDSKQIKDAVSASGEGRIPWPRNYLEWLGQLNSKVCLIQPDALAGDLVFVVQEKPHELFTRKGADLYMKKSITLAEALIGFEFKLKHLDGSVYNLYTSKGEVLGDKEKKVVRGLGMPFLKDSMSFGNLIVEFKIEMPKRG
jgi:DnaJ-class molecular chaperone